MDIESELQLYDHVDFLDSTPISRGKGRTAPISRTVSSRNSNHQINSPHGKHSYRPNYKQKNQGDNVSTLMLESDI